MKLFGSRTKAKSRRDVEAAPTPEPKPEPNPSAPTPPSASIASTESTPSTPSTSPGESFLPHHARAFDDADSEIGRLRESIANVLRACYDPEIPVNIYELGLIYDIKIDDDRNVEIVMTLTSPSCPVAGTLPPEVEGRVRQTDGVASARVAVTWDPPWAMPMMSEIARVDLNMM
jgi:FeS assembly SUF system protein